MKIIKCSNNYVCEVSSVSIDKKAVLQLNFNINTYQIVTNKGWEEKKFPKEVLPSIKDILLIKNDKIQDLIYVLDTFINTGDIILDNTIYTERGYPYIVMKDSQNNIMSMQKSSSASESKLWFGTEINVNEIGENKDNQLICFKPPENTGMLLMDRLHLTKAGASKLRFAILNEMVKKWGPHEIADLIDKQTETANNMIMDVWGDLSESIQKINFGYACGNGNLDIVKKIYNHPENKFLNNIIGTFEEYGMQESMQPESKKVLKFFKEVLKEKEIELSYSMKKWIRDNKLGRKIKIR